MRLTPPSDVRRLVFGTAAFDQTYAGRAGVPFDAGVMLALHALREGIPWFDTAPDYGDAEQVLGQAVAWRPGCHVATKVAGDLSLADLRASLSNSRIALRTNTLDMVQVRATGVSPRILGPLLAELKDQQAHGHIDLVGASVYDEDEALAAIDQRVNIVQVPFNLIDQRMAKHVFPAAHVAGVGIWVRSVWLRGMLAPHSFFAAAGAGAAAFSALEVKRQMWCANFQELAAVSLRFVLAYDAVTGVLIGPRSADELQQAITAAQRGPLGVIRRLIAKTLPVWGPDVYDPRKWR